MSYKSDPRGSRPVTLIAVHTAEGARTAASLGAYFFQPSTQASSHVGIDAAATLQYVDYSRSAWTIRSGNPISDNAELCGFAHWTRAQWLGTGAVEGCANPRAMLDRTADWVRSRCLARGLPIRKLSAADVAAGRSGVIGHVDWTNGMHDGTHTDPGGAFPWDYVMDRAGQVTGGGGGGGGSTPIPTPPVAQKRIAMNSVDVPKSPSSNWVRVPLPGGPNAGIVIRPNLSSGSNAAVNPVWLGNCFGWGNNRAGIGAQYNPKVQAGFDPKVEFPRFYPQPYALWVDVEYSCNDDFVIDGVG